MDEAAKAAVAREYKVLKEAFVSGLNGGSLWEINQVTLVAPASVLLWSALQSQLFLFTPYTPLAGLIDFLLNCAAILFATTLYASKPLLFNYALLVPAAIVVVTSKLQDASRKQTRASKVRNSNGTAKGAQSKPDPLPVKPFVTVYRGTMMVITCAAILAVDFKVFPRRFAKVENWGTSLMDLGVGSFVFSAGVVAARPILKQKLQGDARPLLSRLRAAARHSAPLLVLGLVRLYTVKGLDYAEHVTEYGVHWNFFFTLALLPPFVALFDSAFSLIPSYQILALLLGVAYQVVLDSTDLKAYILTAERVGLLSKNREGIFSFFGYLAIFLAGQGTGMYILPRSTRTGRPMLQNLVMGTAVWITLTYLCMDYRFGNVSVSRRLANLPYILWVCAFQTGQITLFYLIEALLFPDVYDAKTKAQEQERAKEATSRLLRSFNRNGLAIFLLANLLTGLVNLTLPTLKMKDFEAMCVLLAYIGTLSGVALLLDAYKISIKL